MLDEPEDKVLLVVPREGSSDPSDFPSHAATGEHLQIAVLKHWFRAIPLPVNLLESGVRHPRNEHVNHVVVGRVGGPIDRSGAQCLGPSSCFVPNRQTSVGYPARICVGSEGEEVSRADLNQPFKELCLPYYSSL